VVLWRAVIKGRQIAYAAISTAICVTALVVSRYLPLLFVPVAIGILALVFCKFKAGVVSFVLSIIASSILCILIVGVSVTSIVFFAFGLPYSILFVLFYKIKYNSIKSVLVRLVSSVVLGAIASAIVVLFIDVFAQQFGFLDSFVRLQVFFLALAVLTVSFAVFDFVMMGILATLEKRKIIVLSPPNKSIDLKQSDVFDSDDTKDK